MRHELVKGFKLKPFNLKLIVWFKCSLDECYSLSGLGMADVHKTRKRYSDPTIIFGDFLRGLFLIII